MTLPPAWEPWHRTVLRFGAGALEVDLREPVPAPARAALVGLGLAGGFAVVTPCNPGGTILGTEDNARRLQAASGVLAARGLEGVPVTGRSPDGAHEEAGWALAIPKEDAGALAIEWGQAGLYWWDGLQFWIMPAGGEGPEVGLPVQKREGRSER